MLWMLSLGEGVTLESRAKMGMDLCILLLREVIL
jgi:hypothetical protein